MKKLKGLKYSVIFILIFTFVFGQFNIGADAKITYRVYYKGHRYTYSGKAYKVYYNNQLVSSSSKPGMLVNGNVMIPYYSTLVSNGPHIERTYNKKKRSLTLVSGDKKVVLYVNHKAFYVNGVKKKFRTVPFNAKFGRKYNIMIPAKAVLNSLGFGYKYDKASASIYITGNKASAATPTPSYASSNTSNTGSTLSSTYLNMTASRFKGLSTSQFINLMGPLARENYRKTGVLASVTLAQAILESGWGKSYLCQKGNNLFGMKAVISGNNWAGTAWNGVSSIRMKTGEEYGGRKVRITATFRAYKTIYQSVQDHSAYLLNAKNGKKNRYAGLASTSSYAKQIQIIRKGGYATSSSYSNSLIRLIKTYHLTKWDVK